MLEGIGILKLWWIVINDRIHNVLARCLFIYSPYTYFVIFISEIVTILCKWIIYFIQCLNDLVKRRKTFCYTESNYILISWFECQALF